MTDVTCAHPNCDVVMKRGQSCCGRHWNQLPNEYQFQLRQAKSLSAQGAARVDAAAYFESRMIGEHEISTCRGPDCGRDVVWLSGFRKRDGSPYKMLVDADSVSADDTDFDFKKHSVHWETCPNADDFRRPR